MINFNGNILDNNKVLSIENRGFAYGDALFETIKVSHGKILFLEDHYFRLMASMRIMRMEIPMSFTMEYIEEQILKTLESNSLSKSSVRAKFTVFRNEGGLYTPSTNDIGYIISIKVLEDDFYTLNDAFYEVDLFKDYYMSPTLLSTLKSNNKALNIVGSIYAKENNLNNCLILNTNKQVVEALNGNVFLVKGNTIKTPPIEDGCLKGIMRKQIIEILKKVEEYDVVEASISPFEIQKADEVFITNVIVGIQPISKYRKKLFSNEVSKQLIGKLNMSIRLN
ncbi:aminotransferase class IV [Seonamhaeicola maritimus]|uniref:branched-chain-amino-acid transaminase n=1 Tax=Seonamhaeicola maritimus TaxID=2591822 RepID=A0A5C7GG63_9FLAO|nr:aminotransferase class IV [Seonamhaeicola maritimus]TXG35795.1 aminotransferase class IV [Seonamhaeicola maritimus]